LIPGRAPGSESDAAVRAGDHVLALLDGNGRLAQPLLETRLAELRRVAWQRHLLAQLDAEEARVWIDDDLAWVVPRGQLAPDELIEPELLSARPAAALHSPSCLLMNSF
jgi:hypothetical protein